MQSCKIWHSSDGRKFPLETREKGQFQVTVQEISIEDLATVEPDPGTLHTFFIQLETDRLDDLIEILKNARYLQDYPKIIILGNDQYRAASSRLSLLPRVLILDDSLRPQHLKLFLEQVWQLEYYRMLVYNLSHDMRQQKEVYDSLINLARSELQSSRDENEAFEQLQEYERQHREFDVNLSNAREQVESLKNSEILDLKDQLAAMERLSEYRDFEYDRTRAALNATEKVLDLSQQENIERDKIINAMDRLRALTDQELIELLNENKELRGKLGLPERSG